MQFKLFFKIEKKAYRLCMITLCMITLTVPPSQAYPIDFINESIIWKMNLSVVGATSIKFKSAFLHEFGAVNFFYDNLCIWS